MDVVKKSYRAIFFGKCQGLIEFLSTCAIGVFTINL